MLDKHSRADHKFCLFFFLYKGESCCGQRALYPLGMTGIPIYNVNNNCSTGSSALLLAQQLVAGGIVECALAVGFEKMKAGSLTGKVSLS